MLAIFFASLLSSNLTSSKSMFLEYDPHVKVLIFFIFFLAISVIFVLSRPLER